MNILRKHSPPWALLRLLLLLLAILQTPAVQAGEVLRWRWEAGEKLRLELNQKVQQFLQVGQQEVEIGSQLTMFSQLAIQEVSAEGVATLTQKIERIQFTLTLPNLGQVDYDSQATDEPRGLARQLAQHFRPLVGQEFKQKISERGEVLEVHLPEAVRGTATDNPLLRQWLSQQGLEQMIRNTVPVLPADSVEPGLQWESSHPLSTPLGEAQLQVVYRYQGVVTRGERQLDEIDVQLTLALKPLEEERSPGIVIADQSGQGKLWFDRSAGRLSASQMKQQLTVQVQEQDLQLTQRLINTTDVKLLPVVAQPGEVTQGAGRGEVTRAAAGSTASRPTATGDN